jgi:N-acetylglucosamine-6-phosphate deacetylase
MTQAISFLDAPSPQVRTPVQPTTLITHARLPGHEQPICLWVDPQGVIRSIQTMAQAFKQPPPERLQVLNLQGDWLSLGGVDLQINGALGVSFVDLNEENAKKLPEICEFLWQQGIEAFLPTVAAAPIAQIHRALEVIDRYCRKQAKLVNPIKSNRPGTAKILGVHLEGPFLNPDKRGAHNSDHLQPPGLDAVKQVLGNYGELVKIMTLAPELDPEGEVIAYLCSQNIIVSLGYSQATADQAQTAFKRGATLVTHAFNAMPPLHHREVGLLGAALVQPGIRCGLIADGKHVCPLMLELLMRLGSYHDQLFLVSNGIAPLGLANPNENSPPKNIKVQAGTAQRLDGTLVGTTLSLLAGVQNLVEWKICSVDEAIALATTAPRRILGDGWEKSKRDRPFIGRPAHQLLRWHLEAKTRKLSWQRLMSK